LLTSSIVALVDLSRRKALLIALLALAATAGLGAYVATHIRINTDINQLLSDKPAWRQREKQMEAAFPQKVDNLVIVLDGDTAEHAEKAAEALADALRAMPDKFPMVKRPDALPFFRQNGLLFLDKKELGTVLDQITQSQPMLATVASDPSLRGFFGTIGLMVKGTQNGALDRSQIQTPFRAIDATLRGVLSGQDKPLDWEKMMPAATSSVAAQDLRKFILVRPVLDYGALQPGAAATRIIREEAEKLGINPRNGVQLRLTGDVALNDQEFGSVADGAGLATALSGILVMILLFAAMRSWRIVLPIALTLVTGLVASTAFATVAVGSLNLISVAFAVMFIGIAVDFGIQFGVRYRDQHHKEPDHGRAMAKTAATIALPLSMAAASTALGFLSFIPTEYRGVSELGLIAGAGMIIAYFLNLTLLPALLTLMKPRAERAAIGYASLAPLNAYLQKNRKMLLPWVAGVTLVALAVATQLKFDFDPLDLKDPRTESVSTMLDIMRDPNSDAYAAQMLAPSQEAAENLAARLSQLPEVDHVMTLASFIPEDQAKKLTMIQDTLSLLAPTLQMRPQSPPSDEENLHAIRSASSGLHVVGDKFSEAQIMADYLDQLVKRYTPALLKRAQDDIVGPMRQKVGEISGMLQVKPVTLADIPPELREDWVTSDGQWLVEAFPKRTASGNPRDLKALDRFVDAVQRVEPDVAGPPISIRESGRTIVSAFVHAGIYGLIAISLLSFAMLRKVRDVALMLAPLIIAGIFTLATITGVGLPLNYANIIALPLLLSLGVSYAIYFVFFWRSGRKDMLQSSMARAILFSAGTVFVAFVSLCFSAHPGTRGMGVLLTIALVYSLACTFLILPLLLGGYRPDKP
jgi:hopanoid biosynthesis associated RND transporter like protein HpnN